MLEQTDAARVRIRFDNGVTDVEAHVYAWTTYATLDAGSAGTTTLWSAVSVYVVYAELGRLDAEEPLLNSLALSSIINPEWVQVVNTVEQLRIEGTIAVQTKLDNLITTLNETSDAIFDYTAEGYRARQEANDRIYQNYAETIWGTETYVDPGLGAIELPGGFDEVWSTGTGDYVLSNDAFFDPNLSSSLNWELIEPDG